jgi:thioredoxin 1
MVKEPIIVTDDDFETQVLNSDLPVVVDFWAPWCGPCKMVGPILDKLAGEYAGKVVIAKVNTDEDQRYAMEYGVQGIPTMIFVNDGKLVHRQVGALPEPMLRDLFDQFINLAAEAKE